MLWFFKLVFPHEATFASLSPPLALLASLSCFALRLKPRKTGKMIELPPAACEMLFTLLPASLS
jgi:hypothetical protein